jgi:hypothetical protein
VVALADLIADEMSGYQDPALQQAIFGVTDPQAIAAMFEGWVRGHLNSPIHDAWLWAVSVGCVAGVQLVDGSRVVVKAYQPGRSHEALLAVLRAQRHARRAGLAAAQPLTDPAPIGLSRAVAETALAGGRRPDLRDPADRRTVAEGLVQLIDTLRPLSGELRPALAPKSTLVCGLYPTPHSPLFDFEATSSGAAWIDELAAQARAQTAQVQEAPVAVHADWRADNIRVSESGDRVVAIYDWESIRVTPEAVAIGEIAAMHSIDWSDPAGPYFASGAECLAFAEVIQAARPEPFSPAEWSALRAGLVFAWCYTARCEHARAMVGDDKPQFQMRDRLARDGKGLLEPVA